MLHTSGRSNPHKTPLGKALTMRMNTMLWISCCLLAFACLTGPVAGQQKPEDAKAEAVERDRIALQGGWKLVSVEEMGKQRSESEFKDGRYVFLKDKILEMTGDKLNFEIEYEIDPTSNPKRINEYFKVKTKEGKDDEAMIRGIYDLDGDILIICTSAKERPKAFDSKNGVLLELRREKPQPKPEPTSDQE